MPSPIPVAVLARLAVDRNWQGRGIGRLLFRDAALRVARAADAIGIRGIIVHAISEEAKRFYLALGFEPSPREPMTLMVTLATLLSAAPSFATKVKVSVPTKPASAAYTRFGAVPVSTP